MTTREKYIQQKKTLLAKNNKADRLINKSNRTISVYDTNDNIIELSFNTRLLSTLTNTVSLYDAVQSLDADTLNDFNIDDTVCQLLGLPLGSKGDVLLNIVDVPFKNKNNDISFIPIQQVKVALIKAQLMAGGYTLSV